MGPPRPNRDMPTPCPSFPTQQNTGPRPSATAPCDVNQLAIHRRLQALEDKKAAREAHVTNTSGSVLLGYTFFLTDAADATTPAKLKSLRLQGQTVTCQHHAQAFQHCGVEASRGRHLWLHWCQERRHCQPDQGQVKADDGWVALV